MNRISAIILTLAVAVPGSVIPAHHTFARDNFVQPLPQDQARHERDEARRKAEEDRKAERAKQEELLARERQQAARDAERMRQQTTDQSRQDRDRLAAKASMPIDDSKAARKYRKAMAKAQRRFEKEMKKAREEENPWTRGEMVRRADRDYKARKASAESEYRGTIIAKGDDK